MKIYVYKGIGIEDDAFLRDTAPMTKAEVRTVTISKLKPQQGDLVVDIGAGTGSVSVECAFLVQRVISVECEEAAAALISKNAEKFGLANIEVLMGMAPEVLGGIRRADCVFIGGSKGNLPAILDWAYAVLPDGGRIAANFITLENAAECIRVLGAGGYRDMDIAQVQVSKGKNIGSATILQAHNPVFIVSGVRSR